MEVNIAVKVRRTSGALPRGVSLARSPLFASDYGLQGERVNVDSRKGGWVFFERFFPGEGRT